MPPFSSIFLKGPKILELRVELIRRQVSWNCTDKERYMNIIMCTNSQIGNQFIIMKESKYFIGLPKICKYNTMCSSIKCWYRHKCPNSLKDSVHKNVCWHSHRNKFSTPENLGQKRSECAVCGRRHCYDPTFLKKREKKKLVRSEEAYILIV